MRHLLPFLALLVVATACHGGHLAPPTRLAPSTAPTAIAPSPAMPSAASTLSLAPTGTPPDMASCRAWLREQHSLNYPEHGCTDYASVLNTVVKDGAAVIPLGDSKFAMVRFPQNWESLSSRKLIVSLHGSGGCAERMYRWWNRPAARKGYALLVLQYARRDPDAEEGYAFDDSAQIYANLRTLFAQLATHCPLDGTVVVYHGFSRGSARAFEIAMLDRSEEGMKRFAGFIADSGTGFAETGGLLPTFLQNASSNAYQGANFWLYCGGADHDGQTCQDMRRMGPLLEALGATVSTYRYAPGGHGIFATVRPGDPLSTDWDPHTAAS